MGYFWARAETGGEKASLLETRLETDAEAFFEELRIPPFSCKEGKFPSLVGYYFNRQSGGIFLSYSRKINFLSLRPKHS